MLLLLILIHIVTSQPLNCTQSQTAWRLGTWVNLPLTSLVCGLDPMQVLQIDVARLFQPQNVLWITVAHQYCAAQLNRWSAHQLDGCDTSTNGVNQAMLLVGDSLERVCDNVSQWTLEPPLADALERLLWFNQGLLEGCESCLPGTGNVSISDSTFYYYQEPDIVTLRVLDSNTTLTYSLLKGQYNTILALVLFSLGAILVIVVLLLAVVILKNQNRHYQILSNQQQDDVQLESNLDYHTEEYSGIGGSMSDLDIQVSINSDEIHKKDKDV